MTGDLMDKVFGDIKSKKRVQGDEERAESLRSERLMNETLILNDINLKVLRDAIEAATTKRQMIGVWDPEIAAAMQYLKSTIPRYSISKCAAKWIMEGLEREYPQLIDKIRSEMKE
ncbi:hypothetical protein [Methanothrix sp.]|uniref:hypothetical protein n=1 Tax=Methanothrix sp. TaxID=90426 RepID=UPI0034E26E2C